MKKIISIIAAGMMLLFIHIAKAQTFADFRKMTSDQKTKLVSDSLKLNLKLTDAQYKQVYAIVFDAVNKIAPIVKGTGDRMEKGHQVKAVLLDTRAKLRVVLTPEQNELFDAKKTKLIAYYRHKFAGQPIMFNPPTD